MSKTKPNDTATPYLTAQGKEGQGVITSCDDDARFKALHDVLRTCADKGLDLCIVSAHLWDDSYALRYTQATAASLPDTLVKAIAAGGSVRWLVWNSKSGAGTDSQVFTDLLRRVKRLKGTSPGALSIRLSGTTDSADLVPDHIIGCAQNRLHADNDWLLHLELRTSEGHIPPWFETRFGSEAATQGRRMLSVFNALFGAVGRRPSERPAPIPAEMCAADDAQEAQG